MSYIKHTVKRAAGNPGTGLKNRDMLVLIDVDDLDYMPKRDDKGVLIVEDIILRKGRYAYGMYMTPGTVELTSAAEGDTDQIGFKPGLKFTHPGNNLECREFKANNINRKFIGLLLHCSGEPADIIGDICNPCKLTPSYTGNNEANSNEFTLEQINKGDDIGMYAGTIPTEEPVSVVDASATTVLFVAEGQYQLSEGASAINKIEGGSHGAVISLLGVAGTVPTVEHAADSILLRGGKTFTATEGSQLTLRAFEVDEGKVIWIEQSRYVNA